MPNQGIWLFSKKKDLLFLFAPVWVTWLICFSLPNGTLNRDLPLWAWVIVILGIDVSHVWSTTWRTYFDKDEFNRYRTLLIWTPILTFIGLTALSFFGVLIFWRIMAYLAVYHFIKQQYGFLALYRLKAGIRNTKKFFKDKWVLYFSMIYPVVFWHLNDSRAFDWFHENDFLPLNHYLGFSNMPSNITFIASSIYFAILLGWFIEELRTESHPTFLWGKLIWILTTALNWYLGIIYFNSDIAFALTNVVAHGIPYMLLIYFYVDRKRKLTKRKASAGISIAAMCVMVLVLAFSEEFFWDLYINQDKGGFFLSLFPVQYGNVKGSPWINIILAGLSVPQVTHYILDGYIWKGNRNPHLKPIFSNH